jgi:pimeloyl-ACP methyl ester carboxylesterase
MKLTRFWRVTLCSAGSILLLVVLWSVFVKSGRALDLRGEIRSGKGETLVVLVHGYMHGSDSLDGPKRVIDEVFPDADILLPNYYSGMLSNAQPEALASDLERKINDVHKAKQYKRIVLVGHSMGGLLVRKAYVYGCGHVEDRGVYRSVEGSHDWVDKVDRLVLLAGINRGWSISPRPSHMSMLTQAFASLLREFGRLTGTAKLVRGIERGSPFVANLRLQWLDVMRDRTAGNKPAVIQLLGDDDDVVTDEDNKDVAVAQDFVFMIVPKTGHASITQFDDADYGLTRKRQFRDALEISPEILRAENSETPLKLDPNVEKLIFVVHGIRDTGGWTLDLAHYLKEAFSQAGDPPGRLRVVTAQYGYFPMAAFLLVSDRQKNVRWFMDEFTEAKAKYPNLKEINFVGHSNGTFILASALQRYAALKLNRVVFAGSVVPRAYPWKEWLDKGRVTGVCNYTAAGDWVVAIFPRLFELLHERLGVSVWGCDELGSAGFNGFESSAVHDTEVRYLNGDHGAAVFGPTVRKDIYPNMATFLLTGKSAELGSAVVPTQETAIVMCSNLCWLIWLGIAIGLTVAGVLVALIPGRWLHKLLYVAIYVLLLFGLLFTV